MVNWQSLFWYYWWRVVFEYRHSLSLSAIIFLTLYRHILFLLKVHHQEYQDNISILLLPYHLKDSECSVARHGKFEESVRKAAKILLPADESSPLFHTFDLSTRKCGMLFTPTYRRPKSWEDNRARFCVSIRQLVTAFLFALISEAKKNKYLQSIFLFTEGIEPLWCFQGLRFAPAETEKECPGSRITAWAADVVITAESHRRRRKLSMS